MKTSLRNMSLALALMVSAAPLMSLHATAKTSFMAECSAKFKAAKAAKTLGTDTKYTDFMKHQCAADASATAPAAPAVAAKAVAPAVKATAPAAATIAAAPATTPSGSFIANCKVAWKAMRVAKTVPVGMKYKDFVAAKCIATPAAATAPAAGAAATAPAAAATAPMVKPAKVSPPEPTGAADATPPATVDKNGKPLSAKQIAFYARQKTCSNNWRADKAADKAADAIASTAPRKLAAGATWPAYWSDCSKKMKAAGQ